MRFQKKELGLLKKYQFPRGGEGDLFGNFSALFIAGPSRAPIYKNVRLQNNVDKLEEWPISFILCLFIK